ncbi:MAG TPA: LytTR family DNA-binding domain-containing protein [Fibrella sp.]|jgi:two-component system LytT family response regulator
MVNLIHPPTPTHTVGQRKYINMDEVMYLEGFCNYTLIHTSDGKYYVRSLTIKRYDDNMLTKDFFRIHKGYIVNRKYIASVVTKRSKEGAVILKNGKELPLSRRRVAEFIEFHFIAPHDKPL